MDASKSEGIRKPSKYSELKGLENKKHTTSQVSTSNNVSDIEENRENTKEAISEDDADDKVYFPKVISSVLGDIVEKNVDVVDFDYEPMPSSGFPIITSRNKGLTLGKNSVQKQNFDITKQERVQMEVESVPHDRHLPPKSLILSSNDADEIHQENVDVLKKMSEKEILLEQQKLMSSVDPKIIEFIKSKQRTKNAAVEDPVSNNVTDYQMDVKMQDVKSSTHLIDDTIWDNDVFSHPEINKWLHFDSLEKDKLEWMKGIEESKNTVGSDSYEARFNFKGYLLPYSMEYTESTKTLFHHGDEPHRPGYSISELIELSRSTVTQQRVVALNTIAGILEYYSVGTYKDVLDIPLSKLFFIIRIALDENKIIILEPALKAMRNLLYNRLDEASLDALLGFEEGNLQPCLENDRSEVQELDSQESELKDFHLAEIDIIAALLRTDILQRLYYILDIVKPNFNCVQYSLQILTRLTRDSVDTAKKIVGTHHLMESIINHFVPVTSVNFVFEPQMVYKRKPILAALKFLRVLSLQSQGIGNILLMKYDMLKSVSEYIGSGVERSYGLRIQIEAYCVISNLLHYGLAIENAISLCPVIVVSLLKHVQGTEIYANASILTATHGAVVLQFINKLLACNLKNFEEYKNQLYTLIKEGIVRWIGQLSLGQGYTCGHLRLLCSAMDCCVTIHFLENVPISFLKEPLKRLLLSKGFQELIKHLVPSSNILSGLSSKDLHVVNNLMSLGSSIINSSEKVLPILKISSPLPFLLSLSKLIDCVNDKEISEAFLKHLIEYLEKMCNTTPSLCDNWFTRIETNFVMNFFRLSIKHIQSEAEKDLLYGVAGKLCYILRVDKEEELQFLFNNVIFNQEWFTTDRLIQLLNLNDSNESSEGLTSLYDIKMCYSYVFHLNYINRSPNVVLRTWMQPILPRDWVYMPIISLYNKSQGVETTLKIKGEHANRVAEQIAAEKEFIIRCSLKWILFYELCFTDLLNDISITDRFCRIMCVFLCDNSIFLNADIKILLRKCIQILFKKKMSFDFDKPLSGLNNFQDLYTQFLEQFQSVSYGDPTFAACVLVPLAQKHDIKWRKLLWSEYAGCLRFLDCPRELLCYDLEDYFYPEETDESLIKSYLQAFYRKLLRQNSIVLKIAMHHAQCYMRKRSVREMELAV